MAIAVVAYPRIESSDLQWIEGFRALHDPQAPTIPPHFTLVFPHRAPAPELERELSAAACAASEFAFGLKVVQAHRSLDGLTYVFLVPDDGFLELQALHARLNWATQAPAPFTPHVTVGTHKDAESAEAQISSMRARWRTVRGVVDALDLIEAGDAGVKTLVRYPLSGEPAPA